ncbi:hypothetical protein C8J56DRAFT_760600, partial [Mycena floridula]
GGLWFSDGNLWNREIRIPASITQTSQNAVLVAALLALQLVPSSIELIFEAEEEHTMKELCQKLAHWENLGFSGMENKAILKSIAARIRSRIAETKFWMENSPRDSAKNHNAARELAKSGIQKRQPDKIPTTCPPNSGIQGIRVTEITQSQAYKAIMEVKACNL